MEIISGLVGLIKAIPIIDRWFQSLLTFYVNSQIDKMERANFEAVKKAIYDRDQRDLEKAIGSPNAGESSHNPDTVIVDGLPGVRGPSEPKTN
jgi:hypothetical protein